MWRVKQVKFRRSSLLSKLIILALIAYATVTLISLQTQITDTLAASQQLESEIVSLTEQNMQLTDQIAQVNTIEGVTDIARTKLGLVTEGEIVFYDIGR